MIYKGGCLDLKQGTCVRFPHPNLHLGIGVGLSGEPVATTGYYIRLIK